MARKKAMAEEARRRAAHVEMQSAKRKGGGAGGGGTKAQRDKQALLKVQGGEQMLRQRLPALRQYTDLLTPPDAEVSAR